MPKNALTSKPVNKLEQLLSKTAEYPQYGELIDYLNAREMMPPIEQKYLGSNTAGQFIQNLGQSKDLPKTGVLELNYGADPSVVLHELTHAADHQLHSHYYDLKYKKDRYKLTPEEKQFMSSYQKLSYDPDARYTNPAKWPRVQLANKLSPEWTEKHSDYRSRKNELAAWGMGSIAERPGRKEYSPPLHLDPTMATEFTILLDLARRAKSK
jgi:hypothetical protein